MQLAADALEADAVHEANDPPTVEKRAVGAVATKIQIP